MKYAISSAVIRELKKHADSKRAAFVAGYFKTGKGEYGEGDVFWGLSVPQVRAIAKQFRKLPEAEVLQLLRSPVHEQRQCALMILVLQFATADPAGQKRIYDVYLGNTAYINNWDLIDLTAREIVGQYLLNKPGQRKVLYTLARSSSVWERRIAIISAWAFVKYASDTKDLLAIAEILRADTHDLIHKATGWMLREMGKVDENKLYAFLDIHASHMPRTMLRYSVERLPEGRKKHYMAARGR